METLKEMLAVEKMTRITAEANLDAVGSRKADSSEADALRQELQALKDQHQVTLMTVQQESAQVTKEYQAVTSAKEAAEAELARQKADRAKVEKNSKSD